jgi:hypothetical protein
MAEMIQKEPLLPGKGEIDQISLVSFASFFPSLPLPQAVFQPTNKYNCRTNTDNFTLRLPTEQMFKLLGRPSEEIWPGFSKLPNVKNLNLGSVQP